MAEATREYELVLMLDPQSEEAVRDQVVDSVKQSIAGDGELVQEKSWGLRKLAYEIDKRTEADYRWFRFAAAPAMLDQLNHSLKIADGVLRSRVYAIEPGAQVFDSPPPAGAAPARIDATDEDE